MISTTIIGRVVKDPQVSTIKNGTEVVKLLVSCQTDVKGENGYYVTDLFSCWFYGNLGKLVSERVTKGMKVAVGGRSKLSTWTDKDGSFRAGITITASIFDFVGGDSGEAGQSAAPNAGDICF